MFRYFILLLCSVFCVVSHAQVEDSASIPFFDDFACSTDGRVNPRLWQPSAVRINNEYAGNRRTLILSKNPKNKMYDSVSYSQAYQRSAGFATFDILDENGKIYPHTSPIPFTADSLTSRPIKIPSDAQNVYISFDFLPGGIGDMPEAADSLMLYFFNSNTLQWSKAWAASSNSSADKVSDTITQVYPLEDSSAHTYWDGRHFLQAMVAVPNEFCDTGFRFRFVNKASRIGSEIEGILGNCDMWHINLVYLNRDRSPADAGVRDLAVQRLPFSFLKTYTSMPWKHLYSNLNAKNEQMKYKDGFLHLPFVISNISPQQGSGIRADMRLSHIGGSWSKLYDNVTPPSIEADSAREYIPVIPIDTMLASPDVNADSAAFEMQIVLREYNTMAGMQHLLSDNDTMRFVQRFYDYYSYDDGSAENGFGIFGENAQNAEIAVKYHTYKRDTLTGVLMYFNNTLDDSNLQDFTLTIWKGGNTPAEILHTQKAKAQFTGLHQFIWYKLNRKVVVEDDFFIGLKQQTAAMLNIGLDMNNIVYDKTFVRLGYGWIPSRVDSIGSLMIRPSFAPCAWEVETDVKTVPTATFRAYPNPAYDEITLATLTDMPATEYLTIRIVDMTGRCVAVMPFANVISVRNLPAGMYLIQAADRSSHIIAVEKIAVIR